MSITGVHASSPPSEVFRVATKAAAHRFRAANAEEARRWIEELTHLLHAAHPEPFAPPRDRTHVDFLVGGKEYFARLCAALGAARREILISGWMLSPEIFLERESHPPDFSTRLDILLHTKALEGVAVRVLLYDAPAFVLNLRSAANRRHLESLHPGIRVICLRPGVASVYSHHQKFVVVDREEAFLGGIDLAIGRYDDHDHRLADTEGKVWLGADYYNPDFADVPRSAHSLYLDTIDRHHVPRLPVLEILE